MIRGFAALAFAATVGGCLPPPPPLVGHDPADPDARVARTGYRSTIAPYTALRPAAPAPWGGQPGGAAGANSKERP